MSKEGFWGKFEEKCRQKTEELRSKRLKMKEEREKRFAERGEKPGLIGSWFEMMDTAIKLNDFVENNRGEINDAFSRAKETIKAPGSLDPRERGGNFKLAAKGLAVDLVGVVGNYESRVRERQFKEESRILNKIIEIKAEKEKIEQLDNLGETIKQRQQEVVDDISSSGRSIPDQDVTDKLSEKIAAKLENADEKTKRELLKLIGSLP
ncbi:MAG: hypothetical protein CEN90_655 [Parcubacteria group bacterium Licking1014_17]|nr:MAG: hypothetical protein CEN90_655 [Parcubacteria group bacterium Licking1014_17]